MAEPAELRKLNHPWLIAVWPGMGNVALNAGIFLLAKLGMNVIAELDSSSLFDVDHVEVKEGLIQPGKRPRHRFLVWSDPNKRNDLVVFLGEVQPAMGKHTFCRQILEFARDLGVERVFTFAAMATHMHPSHRSRVFGVATDATNLAELKRLELEILQDGNIGGLNGVLLGVAAEMGLQGACLLGEMPHIFSQLPFPKASQAILEAFLTLAGLELDLSELAAQAILMEQRLGEILSRLERNFQSEPQGEDEAILPPPEPEEEESVNPEDLKKIDALFEASKKDRSKAYELKQLLDRLKLFKDYEDRFLDLFKKPN